MLLSAGALAASGKLGILAVVAITVLACILADWIWFEAGRRRGIPANVMLKIAVALARQPAVRDQPLAEAVRQLLEALVRVVLAGQSR